MDNVDSESDDGNVSQLTWNKLQNACHSVKKEIYTIYFKIDARLIYLNLIPFSKVIVKVLPREKSENYKKGLTRAIYPVFNEVSVWQK